MDRARLLQETLSEWARLDRRVQSSFLRRHHITAVTAEYLDGLLADALHDIHFQIRLLAGHDRAVASEIENSLELRFYRSEPRLVRSVVIPGKSSLEEAVDEVAGEMAKPGWTEMRWGFVTRPWGPTWSQPSLRSLRMELDEPELFRALNALRRRHVRNPFFPRG